MAKTPEAEPTQTVHIVDDDDGMRRALITLLGTVGYATAAHARAAEFLAAFEPDEPGCLVLDIRMPEMSGARAAAAIESPRLDAAGPSSSPGTAMCPWRSRP